MDLYTINYIKNNKLVYDYLRINSYWYKYLNRDSGYLKNVEEEAKKYFKVTLEDRIRNFSNNIDTISTFLDLLK
ncbi:MAG: YlbE-like family protein [Bacilli bacterium]|nr:YlbE-like family protein [Bacilli bacterium]